MTKVKSERTPSPTRARKRARTRGSAGAERTSRPRLASRRNSGVRGVRAAPRSRDCAHVQRCEAKREGRGKRPETKTTEANPNANAISTVDLRSPPGSSSSPTTRSRSRIASGSRVPSKKRAKVTSEPEAPSTTTTTSSSSSTTTMKNGNRRVRKPGTRRSRGFEDVDVRGVHADESRVRVALRGVRAMALLEGTTGGVASHGVRHRRLNARRNGSLHRVHLRGYS